MQVESLVTKLKSLVGKFSYVARIPPIPYILPGVIQWKLIHKTPPEETQALGPRPCGIGDFYKGWLLIRKGWLLEAGY